MITRSKMGDLADLKNIVQEVKDELKKVATNEKIDELIKSINDKDVKINELETRIKSLEQSNSLLERKIDDNESYLRRQNLRIIGIPQPADGSNESGDECMEKVKEEISKLGVPLNLDFALDRAHRIGKQKRDENGISIDRPMIVRFTSWHARTVVYRNRIKRGEVRFYTDLTKRRFLLKKHAIEHVKGNDKVKFVFADVNNNICIMLASGVKKVFNSEYEFETLLKNI